jgi:hypothetical protein
LIKKKDYRKAYRSLCDLNKTPLQAARELYYIHAQVEVENLLYSGSPTDLPSSQPTAHNPVSTAKKWILLGDTGFWRRVGQLFSVPRILNALLAAFVVMISQQLCGVNVIGAYPA